MLLWLFAASAGGQDIGTIQNDELDEISGLTRSLKDPKILWGHNDSFNDAVLFRIGLNGEDLGAVKLAGGSLTDWEDIASFRWLGEPALLLADVGDNFGARDHATLYAVRDPGNGNSAELLWALHFQYPDGARDCEAVAVDAEGAEILLLSKRDRPPRLYRLPLPGKPPRKVQIAEFLGEVRSVPPPAAEHRRREGLLRAHYLDMPTAMDISADGRRAVIVTPKDAYLYRRDPKQSWLHALNRVPQIVPLPKFPQIEAGTFSADRRHLYIASEQAPIGFARIALPP